MSSVLATSTHSPANTSSTAVSLDLPHGAKTVAPASMSSMVSLNLNQMSHAGLFVNVTELNLKLYSEIVVSWNVLEETSMLDWIGIYKICKFCLRFFNDF